MNLLFYRRNLDRFFKDRHYFDREFPELLKAGTVLEVGRAGGEAPLHHSHKHSASAAQQAPCIALLTLLLKD